MSRVLAAHQPNFLPWLGLFHKVEQADVWVLADDVQYSRGSLTNRNRIRTASGWQWLTVPVLTRGRGRQQICDVQTEPDGDWRRKHCQSLRWHYGHAPFFDAYAPAIEGLYAGAGPQLIDLNVALLRHLLQLLEVEVEVRFSSQMDLPNERTSRLVDMAKSCDCQVYLAGGVASKAYLDGEAFAAAGIECRFTPFEHPVYPQCHAGFVAEMSVVDLLFNCGPQSREVLFGCA